MNKFDHIIYGGGKLLEYTTTINKNGAAIDFR